MRKLERHGLSRFANKEYRIWAAMKDRCNNPTIIYRRVRSGLTFEEAILFGKGRIKI